MQYEEISLKELILIILSGWKVIIGCALLTTVTAVVFTFGFKPVLYESNANFDISIPTKIDTIYGTFNFPSTNVNEYLVYLTNDEVIKKTLDELNLDMSVASLKNNLSYSFDVNKSTSSVSTTVLSEDPKLSTNIHKTWLKNYLDFIEMKYQKLAIEKLRLQIENALAMDANEQTILQNEIVKLEDFIENLEFDSGISVDYSRTNYIYYRYLDKLTALKIRDFEIVTNDLIYQSNLKELNEILLTNILSDKLNVLEGTILLPEMIVEPVEPIDSGLYMNISIGLVLGFMIGVFIVFIINYWKNESIAS